MEEISSLKRQREEIILPQQGVDEKEDLTTKRQKSYKDIITLLEEEEDLPNEDLSSLISILQEEISSPSSYTSSEPGSARNPVRAEPDPDNMSAAGPEGEEERESVMRHLLEASDDELGLPNNTGSVTDGLDELVGGGVGHVDGGDLFVGGEGIWEFEEYEAANYYSSLQQQIF